PDVWWQTLEVNLRAPLYFAHAFLPGMLARGHGRIIDVSTAAAFAAVPMLSAYVVSKSALYRFSETLAAECHEHGVTAFTLEEESDARRCQRGDVFMLPTGRRHTIRHGRRVNPRPLSASDSRLDIVTHGYGTRWLAGTFSFDD